MDGNLHHKILPYLHNQIIGPFPSKIGQLAAIQEISTRDNLLSGALTEILEMLHQNKIGK